MGARPDPALALYFNRNLQVLELNLLTLSPTYIKYILKYMPDHLNTLHIVLTRVDLYDWMDQVGVDNALKLAGCLSRMKNARIECCPGEEYQRTANTEESKMTRFYKLLGAFKGDRKLYCSATLTDHRTKNELHIKVKNNQKIEFQYEFNPEDHIAHEEDTSEEDTSDEEDTNEEKDINEEEEGTSIEENVIDEEGSNTVEDINTEEDIIDEEDTRGEYAPSYELPLPDITDSIIGPEIINNLDICICRLGSEIPYKILKYALSNCPHLQLLQIDYINTQQKICASPHYDMSPVELEVCDPSLTLQGNVKKIRMENLPLSADIIDLLSTHLPDLETLVCIEGNQLYHRHDYCQMELRTASTVDLTGLGNLQTFCFDIRTMAAHIFDHLIIHFQYPDGEENYYNIEPVI